MAANSASTSGELFEARASVRCPARRPSPRCRRPPPCCRPCRRAGARRRSPSTHGLPGWPRSAGCRRWPGCASDLFSDASAAAVTCAIMKPELSAAVAHQEGRQARQAGVEQQRHAALGDGADLGDRQRDDVGREGHRLGVEVAARDHLAGVGEDQRVVGRRIGLDDAARARHARGCRGRRPSPAACSGSSTGPARGRSRRARARSRCRRAARAPRRPPRSGPAGRAPHGCARRRA